MQNTYIFSNVPPTITSFFPTIIPTSGGVMTISGTQLGQNAMNVLVDVAGVDNGVNVINATGTITTVNIHAGISSGRVSFTLL